MTTSFEYDDDTEAPVELAPWVSWPQCPICAQRRQARCPTCGFAADDFPLADYQEVGATALRASDQRELRVADAELDEALLLMCPQCEEAFRPRFYSRCAACGYFFGEGVRLESGDDDLSPRVFWTFTALVAFLLALCLYFAAILRP
jgi:hypothetical protein